MSPTFGSNPKPLSCRRVSAAFTNLPGALLLQPRMRLSSQRAADLYYNTKPDFLLEEVKKAGESQVNGSALSVLYDGWLVTGSVQKLPAGARSAYNWKRCYDSTGFSVFPLPRRLLSITWQM